MELLAFLDFHQPHVVAIQETKIDSSIATSELFLETCPYSVYRKDRNIHGGGVMLLVHKDISHMHITELEKDSESIWVKVFANKTSHFVASWYRPPGSTSEEFQLFTEQLDYIRTHHMGKKLPSAHVLGDFNFKDIDWPDRLRLKRKNGKSVAQSDLEKAEEFNGQFTDVFNKNEHTQVPLLDRSAPFMNDIAVSNDGVIKLLKGLNPSKALGPDELNPRVLKELATE